MSIMFLGYLTTLVITHTMGVRTKDKIDYATRYLFPAVIESRKALNYFNMQFKSYRDGIVFGEDSFFEEGMESRDKMLDALRKVVHYRQFPVELQTKGDDLLKKITQWSDEAERIYSGLVEMMRTDTLASNIFVSKQFLDENKELQKKYIVLYGELEDFMNLLTDSLTGEYDQIIHQTKIQGFSNIGLFCAVIFFSTIAVVSLLKKIVGPIERLAETARFVQEGDFGRKAEVNNNDEIGELGNAFNQMTEKLGKAVKSLEAEVVERRLAQEEVARHRDNLEDLVNERTSELSVANESLVRLKTAIEQSMDGIAVALIDGTIVFINDAWAKMHDYSVDELKEKNLEKFHRKSQLISEVYPFRKKVLQEGSYEGELINIKKDGTQFPVWMSVSLLKGDNEKAEGMVVVVRDITQQKKYEAELAQANKQLVDSAHKAGMADIAAGTLHNVGNILNSVKTSAQMVREIFKKSQLENLTKANDLLRENMDTLEEFISSGQKGKKLMQYYLKVEEMIKDEHRISEEHVDRLNNKVDAIAEVIAAQQSYAGAATLSEEYSLPDIIEDALTMQLGTIERYNIVVAKEYEKIPKIKVQKTKLVHILINLIRNARDAMLETPADKRVLKLVVDSKDGAAHIKVGDTGSGVEEQVIEKIFTHGFTTKKEGHGFGLHSSANYMTEMGGEMWVESEGLGQGSTFILKFPIDG